MASQIDKGCLMLLEKLDSVANSDKSIDIFRYMYKCMYLLYKQNILMAIHVLVHEICAQLKLFLCYMYDKDISMWYNKLCGSV